MCQFHKKKVWIWLRCQTLQQNSCRLHVLDIELSVKKYGFLSDQFHVWFPVPGFWVIASSVAWPDREATPKIENEFNYLLLDPIHSLSNPTSILLFSHLLTLDISTKSTLLFVYPLWRNIEAHSAKFPASDIRFIP